MRKTHSTYANVDALYREYPWLRNVVPRSEVNQMVLRRWDDQFLQSKPSFWFGGETRRSEPVYLLDRNGEMVTRVKEENFFRFWKKIRSDDEKVGEALVRIGSAAKNVCYGLRHNHYDNRDSPQWVLFILPNGFSNAADWVESEINKAQNELRTCL